MALSVRTLKAKYTKTTLLNWHKLGIHRSSAFQVTKLYNNLFETFSFISFNFQFNFVVCEEFARRLYNEILRMLLGTVPKAKVIIHDKNTINKKDNKVNNKIK